MSFHTIKNLGVAGLVLILSLIVAVAYRYSEQTLHALQEHVELYAPAEASLDSISKLIDTTKLAFTLGTRQGIESELRM